jgi:hypothetical protein
MKIKINQQFLSILLIITQTNCSLNMNMQAKPAKIIFNINDINSQGLRGNETSMRSVSYEFCIPTDKDIARKIKKIDPSLKLYTRARGRINCNNIETLAIGNTHQSQWETILLNLSSQEYIYEIHETFFE